MDYIFVHVINQVIISAPDLEEWVTLDGSGLLALYEEFFPTSFQLPLHPFILSFLDHYRLVPAQLTPNSFKPILLPRWLFQEEGELGI